MKKIICFVIMILMVCFLCSCSIGESTVQSNNTLSPSSTVYIWTDEETGVQYIIYDGYKQGGIYPRLNADGSLHIDYPTEKGGVQE